VVHTQSNPFRARPILASAALSMLSAGLLAMSFAAPSLAAGKPVSLQSLGKPTVTANCKGGSYRAATASAPLLTISGQKSTTGFALTGTNCNTMFTWHIGPGYSELNVMAILDQSDSGPVGVSFRSVGTALKFTANGHNVSMVKVAGSPAHLEVPLHGVHQLSIVLPNGGSDAGILDVTSAHLT
jgi:hypothetical protein